VPINSVKDILTQPDPKGRRGKWIMAMLEYDLEINPMKMIKGQGLAKLMVQSDYDVVGINFIIDLLEDPQEEMCWTHLPHLEGGVNECGDLFPKTSLLHKTH
jgi:hypothetical protein